MLGTMSWVWGLLLRKGFEGIKATALLGKDLSPCYVFICLFPPRLSSSLLAVLRKVDTGSNTQVNTLEHAPLVFTIWINFTAVRKRLGTRVSVPTPGQGQRVESVCGDLLACWFPAQAHGCEIAQKITCRRTNLSLTPPLPLRNVLSDRQDSGSWACFFKKSSFRHQKSLSSELTENSLVQLNSFICFKRGPPQPAIKSEHKY